MLIKKYKSSPQFNTATYFGCFFKEIKSISTHQFSPLHYMGCVYLWLGKLGNRSGGQAAHEVDDWDYGDLPLEN